MPARGKVNSKAGNGSRKVPLRREISAGGIVWRRGSRGVEVAMIRPRGRASWALPKGHVEKGEDAQAAAIREVREETGLEVAGARPIGDIAYIFSWRRKGSLVRISKRVHFFLMEFKGGSTERHDDEIDEARWLTLDEALRRASYADERALIERAGVELGAPPAITDD